MQIVNFNDLSVVEAAMLDRVFYSPNLTKGQKIQAAHIANYSPSSAFRYAKICENKKLVRCRCGSINVRADLIEKRTRKEKRQDNNFNFEYKYTCLKCGAICK